MIHRQKLAIAILMLVGLTGVFAACGGARRPPDFAQEFRGGSTGVRDAGSACW